MMMMRSVIGIGIAALVSVVASAQSTPKPAFELADVHASPRSATTVMRVSSRGGRYEIRNATMVDLIRTAYTVGADEILGGPNWLEYDRFDVVALVPPGTTPDTQKLMLQSLLEDRFKVAVRRDTRPVGGLVLSAGKGKHKLKEAADPAAASGCQTQPVAPAPAAPGSGFRLPMTAVTCRSITLDAFARDLKRLADGYVTNAVVDQTGLKGSWDFELRFTQRALLALSNMDGASVTSLSDAIDQQLGLKLEEQKIPTPVVVVDQATLPPTPNAPDITTRLPPAPPLEFEVADIKPVDPATRRSGPVQAGVQPGGRVYLPGIPLRLVIMLAWNLQANANAQLIGAPKWLDTANFDIIAKLPSDAASPATATGPAGLAVPLQELGPALQALLIDRFKMKVHFEDRLVDAYTLVAARPKMKKADPSTRTGCKAAQNTAPIILNPSAGLPNRVLTCQNITMAQFADQLQIIGAAYIPYPVVDATGLEGGWDFTLSFSPIAPAQLAGLLAGARGAAPPGAGGAGTVTPSDPIGGMSLFDAVEKQLGLKLDTQKRTYPVFVIDHIDDKPTDN